MIKPVKDILESVKIVLGANNDLELARIVKVSPSAVAKWKKRDSTDLTLLLTECDNAGANLHWLLTGEGDKIINKEKNVTYVKALYRELIEETFKVNEHRKEIAKLEMLQQLEGIAMEHGGVSEMTAMKAFNGLARTPEHRDILKDIVPKDIFWALQEINEKRLSDYVNSEKERFEAIESKVEAYLDYRMIEHYINLNTRLASQYDREKHPDPLGIHRNFEKDISDLLPSNNKTQK